MRTMHLFAGAGGGLLADLVLGHTPTVAVEWDPYACAVLRARRDDGWFPDLEIIEGDVRSFDAKPYASRVDCLCFGFPCQDISRMGTGAGVDGERSGLYREGMRVLSELRCEYALIENGPDLVSNGLDAILCDLAALGYDATWCDLSSAATGAAHGRLRTFILAHAVRHGLEGIIWGGGRQRRGQLSEAVVIFKAWPTLTRQDSNGSRRHGYMIAGHSGTTLTDACQIHLGETTRVAGEKRPAMALLNPLFGEWLMRWPIGFTKADWPVSATDKTPSPSPPLGESLEDQ